MASYSLIASVSTVQVLSPTIVNDVVYCTIQTNPSGVIASMPVDQADFSGGTSGTLLAGFADAIEIIMGIPSVIAGQGTQTIDANGLLADQVSFTVQYIPTGQTGTAITAEAVVPVSLLSTVETIGGKTTMSQAEAIITGVYNNLKSAAAG